MNHDEFIEHLKYICDSHEGIFGAILTLNEFKENLSLFKSNKEKTSTAIMNLMDNQKLLSERISYHAEALQILLGYSSEELMQDQFKIIVSGHPDQYDSNINPEEVNKARFKYEKVYVMIEQIGRCINIQHINNVADQFITATQSRRHRDSVQTLMKKKDVFRMQYGNDYRDAFYGLTKWLVDGEIPKNRLPRPHEIHPKCAQMNYEINTL